MFKILNLQHNLNNDFSLQIRQLEIPNQSLISITGKSGSGKSTLLKLFSRLISPHQGQVLWDGKNLEDLNIHQVRNQIKYIPQNPDFTCQNLDAEMKNVFSFKGHQHLKYLESDLTIILQNLNLEQINFKQNLTLFSGGEKQRLHLALTLLLQPKILLLDEPSSALDESSSASVIECLKKLNIPTIAVTHSPQWIEASDSVIKLEKGQVVNTSMKEFAHDH